MDSSDDEGEFLPDSVTNYAFLDETDRPVCFSRLPLRFETEPVVETEEAECEAKTRVYMDGEYDGGLGNMYKQVVAWRYEIREGGVEVYVLCKGKGKRWVRLVKPKKGFEVMVRGVLATVCCLGYVRGNERAEKGDVFRHLKEAFSLFEVGPSEDDILSRIELIRDAVKRDEELAKSEYMLEILPELPRKTEVTEQHQEDCQPVDPNIHAKSEDDDLMDYGEEDELFDTCCGLCDNGGHILCCVGRCMRSFHPTVSSQDGNCESLGLSDAQVEALPFFLCKNYKYERHVFSL